MAQTNGHGRAAKQKAVLEALKVGNTRRAAWKAAGVPERTFYLWLETDCSFLLAVEKAEAEAELETVGIIRAAGRESWQAAAWWLERHPRTKADWKRLDELNLRSLTVEQLLAIESACAQRVESAGDRAALAGAASEPAE